MANIKPFRAVRPKPGFAKRVASRPYDVLNSKEAKAESAGNPDSFLHITKSEIDLPEDIDIHSRQVYDKAKENLDAFLKKGILHKDEKGCYYIYQLMMPGRGIAGGGWNQTGLVCVSSVDDYESGIIKKHELTRPDKELDRINHIKTTGAQTGNVFLTYQTDETLHKSIEDWKSSHHPEYDFIADDGVQHMVWVINDDATNDRITKLFADKISSTYIADGHHRAASAARVRAAVREKNLGEADYFLTTLFPSDQLHILEYNRVVKDLNGLTEAELLKSLENYFLVEKTEKSFSPHRLHQFGMYVNGSWYELIAKEGSYREDPIGLLDVSILQENVLDRILSIRDPRTDKRIDFVGGIRGLQELEKRVDGGEWKLAFNLYPLTIQQLFDIADTGHVMPPKSTWFEPKLRDGLLTHLIY
jgi:uncharacterized protein (DUF1015 family)